VVKLIVQSAVLFFKITTTVLLFRIILSKYLTYHYSSQVKKKRPVRKISNQSSPGDDVVNGFNLVYELSGTLVAEPWGNIVGEAKSDCVTKSLHYHF